MNWPLKSWNTFKWVVQAFTFPTIAVTIKFWYLDSIFGLQLQEQFNSASSQEENEIKREENVWQGTSRATITVKYATIYIWERAIIMQ